MNEKFRNFIKEYESLCQKYNLTITSPTDVSLEIAEYDKYGIDDVKHAYILVDELGYYDWEGDNETLEFLVKYKDQLSDVLFNSIGNDKWCLIDKDIFDLVECKVVRPATQEELVMKDTIRFLELKIKKYL